MSTFDQTLNMMMSNQQNVEDDDDSSYLSTLVCHVCQKKEQVVDSTNDNIPQEVRTQQPKDLIQTLLA